MKCERCDSDGTIVPGEGPGDGTVLCEDCEVHLRDKFLSPAEAGKRVDEYVLASTAQVMNAIFRARW